MLLLLLACTPQTAALLEQEAEAATTVTCSRPTGANHQTIDSTTDWDLYTVPNWVRWVTVCNFHASASVYWGDPTETSTVNLASDHYKTIPAGVCWGDSIVASPTALPSAASRVVPLHSTTASHPIDIVCYESVQ